MEAFQELMKALGNDELPETDERLENILQARKEAAEWQRARDKRKAPSRAAAPSDADADADADANADAVMEDAEASETDMVIEGESAEVAAAQRVRPSSASSGSFGASRPLAANVAAIAADRARAAAIRAAEAAEKAQSALRQVNETTAELSREQEKVARLSATLAKEREEAAAAQAVANIRKEEATESEKAAAQAKEAQEKPESGAMAYTRAGRPRQALIIVETYEGEEEGRGPGLASLACCHVDGELMRDALERCDFEVSSAARCRSVR